MRTMNRKEFLGLTGSAFLGCFFSDMKRVFSLMTETKVKTGKDDARITIKLYDLKLRHAWGLSRGTWTTRRNCFVRLEKDGVVGYGEAAPILRYQETAEQAAAFIARCLPILKKDIFAYAERWHEIDSLASGDNAAKAALDMAMLDWFGKKYRMPLWRLLGLDKQKALSTTYSIGIDTVPVMQQKVSEATEFDVYKIKVGTDDDRKIIEGIRQVTDKPLRVDANEGWTSKEKALEMINWLADMNVELIEQPLPAAQLDDYAWLKERSRMPIFADESVMKTSDIPNIAPFFHGINIKLMKCGGVQEAIRMAGLARAFGLKLMIGCMIESSLAISAAAALTPLFDYADLDGNLLVDNDPFLGVATIKGKLVLTDRPGLGVENKLF